MIGKYDLGKTFLAGMPERSREKAFEVPIYTARGESEG